MRLTHVLTLFAGLLPTAALAQAKLPYQDTSLTPEQRAHDLVSRLTLEEKAAQSVNTAPAIPRLGVPAYDYWNEGLHGIARSGHSTLFPQAIGMAATWDAPLLQQIGDVVSTEARAKYNDAVRKDIHSIYFGLTIWSPNINIFRDPRWGRGQETYGEDPYLTGSLGLSFVRGLQGPDPQHPRAIATPKHFAVHSGPENTRHSANIDPSAHDLWETYLPQFRRTIVEGQAGSIMCAYNAIYGKPACASDLLLKEILRDAWKFKGFVTSDCGAIDDFYQKTAHRYSPDKEHASAAGVLAGTDTNCGRTYQVLPASVRAGLLKESDLDATLERLFTARMRLGLFDPPSSSPYAQIPYSQDRAPAHLALSERAAKESMVLLKNDGILPLQPAKYKKVAVIGPNAASLAALEGNYNAVPKDPEMPVDTLRKSLRGAQVVYAEGAPYADGAPLPVPSTMFRTAATGGRNGLKAEYFNGSDGDIFAGKPTTVRQDPQIDFDWNSAAPVDAVKQEFFGVRWTGYIAAPQAGDFEFNMRLAHCYPCGDEERYRVTVDGHEVANFSTPAKDFRESTTPRFHIRFEDTKPHSIEVTYVHKAPLFGGGLTMEWVPPAGLLQQQAAEAARDADMVIAMIGLSPELEGEEMKIKVEGFDGGDRTDIKLPASQQQMLEAVAQSGKPMVVVLMNGSALAAPWAQEHANAILEAWYPGEFGGKAIADTLLGVYNPAGRLPVTFYRSVGDLPAFDDYSMKNRTYRYFQGTPLYGFGYGLSYTTFTYSGAKAATNELHAGDPLKVEVTVTNSGKRAGEEVAQLYLLPPAGGNGGLSPKLQLEGFERVTLKPGEARKLAFELSARDLSQVDGDGNRVVLPGEYSIAIGGSQPGAQSQTVSFRISGSYPVPR
ncbi:glycoside hydrolase family 3 C-terminal domain-containing protein [Terriglobus sp. 2YAB30_2]|uniref:glycoside hydrolase family 3 C-terminal domain-containing protein n=1 Tax=unclassified Terriglobus TaxID=2628988 RepID=UPI003F94EC5E